MGCGRRKGSFWEPFFCQAVWVQNGGSRGFLSVPSVVVGWN